MPVRRLQRRREEMFGLKGKLVTTARCARTGRLLWTRESDNLALMSGTRAVAQSFGGSVLPYDIKLIGVGTGVENPAIADIGLSLPSYYRVIDSVSFPVVPVSSPAQVRFTFSINAGAVKDFGATNIDAQELMLLCDPQRFVAEKISIH